MGLYWQRYGVVAPDEEISRLEDEYWRSAGMPRLLYVMEPAPRREPRLAGLLRRIQADDTASYKPFADRAELSRLLGEDLARLLAPGGQIYFETPHPKSLTLSSPRGRAAGGLRRST